MTSAVYKAGSDVLSLTYLLLGDYLSISLIIYSPVDLAGVIEWGVLFLMNPQVDGYFTSGLTIDLPASCVSYAADFVLVTDVLASK